MKFVWIHITNRIGRQPVIAIWLTMAFTFLLFVPLGLNAGNSYITFSRTITKNNHLQHLTDTITYLDEVLTMSARMNATTGDTRWEQRYLKYVPQLDAAIREVRELSPDLYKMEGTAETDAANDQLVAMESQSFDWVRAGNSAAAANSLNGRSYQTQKRIYTAGVQRSNDEIYRRIELAQQRFSHSLWVSIAISVLSLLILLPLWIGVLKALSQYLIDLNLERCKTRELNASLEQRVEQRTFELTRALQDLRQTQSQLVQAEKMSSLGQITAGIAHEVNNPISFIQGNIPALTHYFQDLLELIALYQIECPQPAAAIVAMQENIDIDFLINDVPKILSSMNIGTTRVCDIVLSLRNYSRLDESALKDVDIHEGIESTLLILNHRINHNIEVIKNYGALPLVSCSPSQLNQVFTNIISNALDAMLEDDGKPKQLIITTCTIHSDRVQISLRDTGSGMSVGVKDKIFDPFFTTKPVGTGTGLGLGICFKIIQQHRGNIEVVTAIGQGTEFIITLPVAVASAMLVSSTGEKLKPVLF